MTRGRPGPRRPRPAYVLAISCRCQREEGIGRDQVYRSRSTRRPRLLAFAGQAPRWASVTRSRPGPSCSRRTRFFLERVNDVTLLLVESSPRRPRRGTATRGEQATYGASLAEALGGHERRDPASVQRRISPSDGVDRGSWTVRRRSPRGAQAVASGCWSRVASSVAADAWTSWTDRTVTGHGSRPLSGHGPADQGAAVGSPMADD